MEYPQPDEPVPSDESPAQKQARLRRERREAKIKAGGSARLDKITQVSGRSAEAAAPALPAQNPHPSSVADPDEGDISNHQYPTRKSPGDEGPTEGDIRQVLRSAPLPEDARHGAGQQQAGGQDDPMVRMLQQMMGGLPGMQEGAPGGLPPGLGALLGGGGPTLPGTTGQGERGEGEDTYGYLWKIIHAIFALLLGIYMTAVTTFNGAEFARAETLLGSAEGEVGKRLFWIFGTAEVALQGSRYLLEKGKSSQAWWMSMLTQVLPEPWRSYVGLVARYSGIWTTIVEDAMVVVFVLGCVVWWKGDLG
ncbi:MAG: hypothetical protein Q9211_000242 [Gyalolechia sp. 1 TL-2023]